jgi:hypothetical protein
MQLTRDRQTAAQVCCLANNHVLDWQEAGLVETLDTLRDAGEGWVGGSWRWVHVCVCVVAAGGSGQVQNVLRLYDGQCSPAMYE